MKRFLSQAAEDEKIRGDREGIRLRRERDSARWAVERRQEELQKAQESLQGREKRLATRIKGIQAGPAMLQSPPREDSPKARAAAENRKRKATGIAQLPTRQEDVFPSKVVFTLDEDDEALKKSAVGSNAYFEGYKLVFRPLPKKLRLSNDPADTAFSFKSVAQKRKK